MFKLIRGYLSQPLKSCHFGIWSQCRYGFGFFIRRIAVLCCFLIPYPEKRGLENIYMTFSDKVGKKLKEKCEQKEPDMHPINVRVSSNYNIIISQVFDSVFNVKC